MRTQSLYLLEHFMVRKSKRQKETFRAWLCEELAQAGYAPRVEGGGSFLKSHNVMVGDAERAEILLTAHYDTCAELPFPNFITPRNLFWYLLYQLLITLGIFALAIGAEVAVIALLDAPAYAAMLVMDAVLFFCIWWMMAGPANPRTVNDNTSGVLTLLETALNLQPELRERVCFVFFDNEELGLFGSAAFAKKHKSVKKNKLILNFDCVSDGDYLQLYPTKTVKRDEKTLRQLEEAYLPLGNKQVEVVRGFGFYPSDQRNFQRGVGICALKKNWAGYYLDRIHTRKDTALDERNIECLVQGNLRLLERLKEM